jgi:hypothetical protein
VFEARKGGGETAVVGWMKGGGVTSDKLHTHKPVVTGTVFAQV